MIGGESMDGTAPAPWALTGRGYIVLLRPQTARETPPDVPAQLAAAPTSGPALIMYVDYASSGVGPYRELLYIPGRFLERGRRRWSVSHIVVSTEDSVRAGRANWGIPKALAQFDTHPVDGGGERIVVTRDGRRIAELEFGPAGLRLPGGGGLLPAPWRRMVQYLNGYRYAFTPTAHGPIAWASLRSLQTDGELFPELGPERVLAVFAAPDFRLGFPVAEVEAIA